MSDLTDDELTVLTLAAQGAPMIPIGRWKAPAEKLIRLGYLQPTPSAGDPSGGFNLQATEKGKALALSQHQEEEARQDEALRGFLQRAGIQQQLALKGQEIAKQLAEMATLSVTVKKATRKEALREWSRIILERALELIGK